MKIFLLLPVDCKVQQDLKSRRKQTPEHTLRGSASTSLDTVKSAITEFDLSPSDIVLIDTDRTDSNFQAVCDYLRDRKSFPINRVMKFDYKADFKTEIARALATLAPKPTTQAPAAASSPIGGSKSSASAPARPLAPAGMSKKPVF